MSEKKRLSTRFIVVLPVVVTLVFFLLIFMSVFYANMHGMLAESEREHTRQQSDMIAGVIETSFKSGRMSGRDLSSWDETHAFALGRNPAYIGEKWETHAALRQHDFNFVVIKDLSGNDLYAEFYDYNEQRTLPIPAGFTDFLSPIADHMLRNYRSQNTPGFDETIGESGFAFYDGTAYYISSLPILDDGEDAPPAGSMFFGRVFNNNRIQRLLNTTEMTFSALAALPREAQESGYTHTDDSIYLYKALPSFPGYDTIFLEARIARSLYANGMQLLRSTRKALAAVMLLLVAVIFYMLEWNVLRPIKRLSSDVNLVSAETSSIDPDSYGNNREFYMLSTSINAMLSRLAESRRKSEETAISMNILQNILNGMSAYVYVSDLETDEILFINEKMNEHFAPGLDLTGKICWKVLQSGFEQRCGFCPNYKLLENTDTPFVWDEHNTVTGRFYKNFDRIIEWTGGKKAHLQHSIDITDLKETESLLKRRLEQQELMAALSQNFISGGDIDAMITKALQMAGEFMGISRILLLEYQERSLYYRYEWLNRSCADGAKQAASKLGLVLSLDDMEDAVVQAFIQKNIKHFNLDEGDHDRIIRRYNLDMTTFLMLPIYMKDEFWGLLEFDRCEGGKTVPWTSSDVDLGGLVAGVLSSAMNRRLMEGQLVQLSTMVETSPQYISFVSEEGTFEYVNSAVTEFTGYPKDELLGHGMELLFDEETNRRIRLAILPVIREKGKFRFELPIIRKDRETRIMAFSSFTIGASGIGTIAMDITEMRRMENDLLRAKELAELANRAKSEFLSRMSHEIRTPMNAIVGMTQIAKDACDMNAMYRCLHKIEISSKHLLSIINDILDLSKIEANKLELNNEDFCLESSLIDICGVITVRSDEKKQNLSVHIDHDLPTHFVGDSLRLSQVLTNLLANAVKFTPAAGCIRLRVSLLARDDLFSTLRFEVADTGIGMSPEETSRLFTPFEQADGSISRRFGGSGLGLAISKKIVELMDGEIGAESVPGEGSRFIFIVRLRNSRPHDAAAFSSKVNIGSLNVLAVDDAPEILQYFEHLLGEYKIRVRTASGGQEAISLLREAKRRDDPFNLIFMDWLMPEMDGIETARRIKEEFGEHPVIILISMSQLGIMEKEAREVGIKKYLGKPLFASTIINAINELLDYSGDRAATLQKKNLDLSGKRVLLAEDMDINREIFCGLVEKTRVDVDMAENGQEALELVKSNPGRYGLIFMDIHMPLMDGYSTVTAIREWEADGGVRRVPIVAMTANVFREDVEKCLAVGMDDHLPKPLDKSKLFEKLAFYLGVKTAVDAPEDMPEQKSDREETKKESPDKRYVDVAEGIDRVGGSIALYKKLLTSFKSNTRLAALPDALDKQDYSAAKDAAHAIKGVASNISLKELYQEMIRLETVFKEGAALTPDDAGRVRSCIDGTLKQIDIAISEMRE